MWEHLITQGKSLRDGGEKKKEYDQGHRRRGHQVKVR